MSNLFNVRQAVVSLINKFISPYVDNLNSSDLNLAIMAGDLTLHNLHLKRSAVEKYNLPIEVLEGHVGHLHITIPWFSLRTAPITITVEDVFLLCRMKSESTSSGSTKEDFLKDQEAKQEKLRNAENLDNAAAAGQVTADGAAGGPAGGAETQTWLGALTQKLVDNVQVTVKNIHLRYEDDRSTPEHPFAAGFTLASFRAVSVNENWIEAFITSTTSAGVRKLASLDGLSMYFDTDEGSIYREGPGDGTAGAKEGREWMMSRFMDLISRSEKPVPHQYILKPVKGEARVILNKHISATDAKTEAQVFFDEIGFVLDDDQYRDALSMLDLFHFYTRTHQYRRFRPPDAMMIESPARARWKFATAAIRSEVHERNEKWTWDYLATRRDNRKAYVELFLKTLPGNKPLVGEDLAVMEKLEMDLSYEDIRFFRSVAKVQAMKDAEVRKKLDEEKKKQQGEAAKGTWLGWVWGGGGKAKSATDTDGDEPTITEADKEQLNDLIDYNPTAQSQSADFPKDYLTLKVTATLSKGSLSLRSQPRGRNREILALVFDSFSADVSQMVASLDGTFSLGGFSVYDGTTDNSLYPKIVRVKDSVASSQLEDGKNVDPFFVVRVENKPLDGRADNAVTVKMRHLEIIYHRSYVEAVIAFFVPPASQLESMNALLDAAGQTFEGIRKETRAGLEFALEQHKRFDLQVDMNAPIVIIPESVITEKCLHMVLDAGHIAINSKLANQDDVRQLQSKRGKEFSETDFQQLEDLMYDRFDLRLEATQLLIGMDLQSCLHAAESSDGRKAQLHIVERISMAFQVHNAIVNAPNLTRVKVSGSLPELQINLSDAKYKGLMKIIDIAIPAKTEDAAPPVQRPRFPPANSNVFRSRAIVEEYVLDDDDDDKIYADPGDDLGNMQHQDPNKDQEVFFEAPDAPSEAQMQDLKQISFEFDFKVGELKASLLKAGNDGMERLLADAALHGFGLTFQLRKWDMSVDVYLNALSLDMVDTNLKDGRCITSGTQTAESQDLVRIRYLRVQKESPEYMSVHEGVDQSIEADVSTINIHVEPKPIITLYAFIMTTFVPEPKEGEKTMTEHEPGSEALPDTPSSDKIRIRAKLTSIQLILQNAEVQFATLALTAADVTLLLRSGTMRLIATLGNLTLSDDAPGSNGRKLLDIEGKELADFSYETFDPSEEETFPGYNSFIKLRAGSLRFTFIEHSIRHLSSFGSHMAQLKALYDAASEAAMQRAAEVTRMRFDVSVKTPIVILPSSSVTSDEVLCIRLGEISTTNAYGSHPSDDVKTNAKLSGINVSSGRASEIDRNARHMLSDVHLELSLTQRSAQKLKEDSNLSETEVAGTTNEIKLGLTQEQYGLLMDIVTTLPKALASEDSADDDVPAPAVLKTADRARRRSSMVLAAKVDPIATLESGAPSAFNKIAFRFTVPSINLEVFGAQASGSASPTDGSISRFRLGKAAIVYKTMSDQSVQAEVSVKSFTMTNTRAGKSVYRELIPEAKHGGNQFMLQYVVTGLPEKTALLLVTIDSPEIVLVMDPLFALVDFAVSPFKRQEVTAPQPDEEALVLDGNSPPGTPHKPAAPPVPLSYRVEVAHSEIMVVSSDTEAKAQAIQLSIKDIVIAQQSKTTLVVHNLGMSFGRMDLPNERVRFLDEIDVTLALDSSGAGISRETRIELALQKVILRASYTNILLLTDIINKAIALAAAARMEPALGVPEADEDDAVTISAARRRKSSAAAQKAASSTATRRTSVSNLRRSSLNRKPQVIVTKESMTSSVEGFQLVLIGDLHELPLLHLSTEAFLLSVNDWSGDMKANTAFLTSINYYNMINSYWEPVMDPWDLQIKVSRTINPGADAIMAVSLASKRRLEMNLTSAFIEMAITNATLWSKESDRLIKEGGGTDAPFRLVNKTGYSILVWSDSDRSKTKSFDIKKVADGEEIPWRFHDHKRTRENISSSTRNAFGVQVENMPWEKLRNMSVDIEGEVGYTLRPKLQKVSHRLVCDVRLKDNVKIVTLRSSFKIENKTHLPMEMVIVDSSGKVTNSVYKLPPGEDCPLPIEAAVHGRFRLRPDRGFDYNWSADSFSWQDLMRRPIRSIACRHRTPDEAAFRFQAESLFDKKDPIAKIYPRLTLRLRAPIEVENLLPYNIRYRVYDKNTRTNTTNFLIKGGSSPIHTVELDHLLLLSVEAQDSGLKQSEFAIVNTDNPDDFRTEDVLVVHDRNDVKLNLKLHYFTYPGSGGAFKVQVYSPYVILNKTGLPFSISIKNWSGSQKAVAGQEMFQDDHRRPEPTPFMFAFPHEERNNRLFLRVGDSEWSRAISVEGVGADSEIRMSSRADESEYHIGFSYAQGLGKYKLSKVITLTPRYLVKNEGTRALKIRQYRTQNYRDLKPGRRIPWHAFNNNAPEQFCLAWDSPNLQWSAPVNITELGRIHLTLPPTGESGGSAGHRDLLKIDTRLDGACIFLIIAEETGRWPLRIRNETAQAFLFQQTEDRDSEGLAQDRVLTRLNPYSFSEYSWDSPAATGKKIRLVADGQEREIDIMEIGSLPPWKFMSAQSRRGGAGRSAQIVALDVRADGMSQMLVLSPYVEEESAYKPKRRPDALLRSESSDSLNTMAFETVMETSKPTLTVFVNLEGIGLSIIDRKLREIVYASFRGLVFSFTDHPTYRDWNFDCKWIQIDNQLFGGLFPIVLYPSTSPSSGKELDAHPTLQLSAAVLKDEDHGVHYIKYATILLQSMTVELDEDFLFALLDFAKFENASWKEPALDVLMLHPVDIPEPPSTNGGKQIYFEDLLLQPVQVELSFMRTDRVNVDDKLSTSNPVAFFINALTMALGNVNAAPLKLNALIVHNVRLTTEGLQERMMIHYREQIMSQLYRVLGSADFLGNPVGLFNNISSGVADVFYEPYQGMVMHGNKDLGMGIARGVTSLGKKTIFGVTDSMTKVTSSVGKGLAAATLDSEYQARRRAAQRRNKPKHALYGFINGANAFASSVASGVEGLTLKPIEGAQADGVGGFFKGVGKGFVGALTKPVVGVFDFASTVTEGIRNTTSVFDGDMIDRVRLPRYTGADGILKPYNEREALGQSWLKNLEDGRYASEDYVAHLDLTGDDSVVMLTTSRILLIRSTKLRVLWEVSFADLQTISLEPTGLSLVLKGDVGGPFIPLAEQSQRLFLFKHVETVVRKHNDNRKSAES